MNKDNIIRVPIKDLHFKKKAETLPAELVDRIIIIHEVFKDYLSTTLEKTIDNFKYDSHPEKEVCIWEHMASTIITLKRQEGWAEEKMKAAVKVVLCLSMGEIQENTLSEEDTKKIIATWVDRTPR